MNDSTTCNLLAGYCKPGVIIPVWTPIDNLTIGDTIGRAFVYGAGLIFCFLGVGIISDRFMSAIEVITSQEKEIHIVDNDGNKQVVMVRYWNETVSNLTLMALGSSAPEILLSVIEIFGNRFEAGDLGPNTIVGSAAYNLFVIIGYIITVVPKGEIRRIKHLRVFFVTATWSIFAYIWLYLIIAVFSRGIIDVWEGVLTFLFFPITVGSAYVADQKIFFGQFLEKKVKGGKLMNGDEEHGQQMAVVKSDNDSHRGSRTSVVQSDAQKTFEDQRQEYINVLKELRTKYPDIGIDELQNMAEIEILQRGPKSRAFYRISAARKMVGGNAAQLKKKVEEKNQMIASRSKSNLEVVIEDENMTTVAWDPSHYTCFESVGKLEVFVSRTGGDLNRTVSVDYKTENGTAESGTDFEYAEGTLVFGPNELKKSFSIKIIDDDVYEEDEQFSIRLSNVRFDDTSSLNPNNNPLSKVKCFPEVCTVMILDDDHNGIFVFPEPQIECIESVGTLRVKVQRTCGARGKVKVPFRTSDNTALAGKDYIGKEDVLTFYNNEIEKFIEIEIFDDEDYEKSESFFIELDAPISEVGKDEEDVNEAGKPKVGEVGKIEIQIRESKEIKGIVDKLLVANTSMLVGTSSWREQFLEAFEVEVSGDDEEGEEGDEDAEPRAPSVYDYVIHYISLFWKVLFAFCPPTDILGGWACFWVSMGIIGCLTALIGDLASSFGCTVGLKDSVTAISFVALGTSLPDTFASKVAAQNDKYADGSIGNVTGSNAVNVFLGIGIAWTIAAVYHAFNGTQFNVNPGNLGFSVTIFCFFALVAISLMMFRRFNPYIGAELGGPQIPRYVTSLIFFGLWLSYVTLSTLEAYCVIEGF